MDKVFFITKSWYMDRIQYDYAKKLSQLSPEELYDNYNPGPTKPDGSVNFECHCVSHLVASPCGHAFRDLLLCQKTATEKELDEGACTEELMKFMTCATETGCFRTRDDTKRETKDDKS